MNRLISFPPLQAFTIYEEEITESKAQVDLIAELTATLERMRTFGEDNFTPLATKYEGERGCAGC